MTSVTSDQAAAGGRSLLRPIRNRSYRYLYLGQTVSGLGNGMYTITLAWTVYSVTGSASDMGIVMIANVLPQIGFMIFGGAIADRIPRRRVILASNVVAGLVTLAMAVAAALRALDLGTLICCSFLLGLSTAFFEPAFSAIFREVLEPGELRAGNALRGMTANVNRLVSPALGGAAYLWGGSKVGFGFDAATFFFAAVTVAMISASGSPSPASEQSLLRDVKDGFSYLAATQWIFVLVLIALILNTLCIAPMEVLLALVVRQAHQGSLVLGTALSVQAGAAALGAAAVGKFGGRLRSGVAFFGLAGIMTCGVTIVGLNAGAWTIVAGMALVGAGFTFGVIEDTVLQRYIPNEYLGRVYSVGGVAAYSLLPLGYAWAGIGAVRFGPGPVLVGGGVLAILACGAAYAVTMRKPDSVLSQHF